VHVILDDRTALWGAAAVALGPPAAAPLGARV